MKKAGRMIKYLIIATIIICNAALIIRVYMARDSSVFSGIYINDTLSSAYSAYVKSASEDAFAETYEVAEKTTYNGEFSAYSAIYIPSAKQLQVTVRMNDSTLRNYSLNSVDDIKFTLCDPEENFNFEAGRLTERKFMYNYIKLIFDNVILPEGQLYLVSYINNGEKRLAGLIMYDSEIEPAEYKLSKSEIDQFLANRAS